MTTALITHGDCLRHINPPGHPERHERLEAIWAALEAEEFAYLVRVEAPLAEDAQHPARASGRLPRAAAGAVAAAGLCADRCRHLPDAGDARPPPAARRARWCRAVDMVMAGEVRNAFCAVRPPGHHAETATAMGFCFFGNAVIGARHALEAHGLERVAIVDWDVHHGNGTQDLVWDDPRILFASTHQMPLYPGTGAAEERGAHGQVVNVPLPPGAGGGVFRAGMLGRVLPAVEAHAPQMIFVSAGLRRACARPAGQPQPRRGRLRLGDGAALRARRPVLRRADRLDSRGRI